MPCKPPCSLPEVLRLKSEGLTNLQVASHFGISRSRVGQIIEREWHQGLSVERSAALRNEIRTGNGIGKKLPMADLFCVLDLPKRAQAVLVAHFNRQGTTDFSLLDMMDFLLPVVEDAKDHYDHMPAYRVRMLGQILYSSMIKALSAVDCGEAFRVEWAARKKRLRGYLIGTGVSHPCILNGKGAA